MTPKQLLTLVFLLPLASAVGDDRLNVLFIAADDLGNVIGPNKPAILKTPNFDRLIARGVLFEQAYCQIPLCNPSRASVMTGRRPDVTTVWDLDRHFREALPDVVTLSQHFRNEGYWAGRVGKIYHYDVPRGIGTDGLDDKPSWDQVWNPKGRDVADEDKITNPTPWKKVSAAMCWLAADGTDGEQTDGMITTEAIRQLEIHADRYRTQNEPFFLATGWFRPHTPYVAPKKYFDMYPLDQIELPRETLEGVEGEDVWKDIPPAAIPHNVPEPNYGLGVDDLKKSLQAYYACVSFLDVQLGRLLDALDENKLSDKTVIVFWSDHGYQLGEHALWQKRTLYHESSRAPLIVAAPGDAFAKDEVVEAVVEFVDIAPTVADLAGVAPFEDGDGKSLRPLLEDPRSPWTGEAYTQILRPAREDVHNGEMVLGRAVTTDFWRYIEWDEGRAGSQLFNRRTDFHEWTNVVDDPLHKLIRDKLAEKIKTVTGKIPSEPVVQKRL